MKLFSRWWGRPVADAGSVYVTEKFGVRSLHIGSDTIQSSMRLARPYDLELAYTRSMMAFLLFQPEPARVLLVGLGGGSLAKFIHRRMPGTVSEVVEINPDVVAIARRFFQVPAADERLVVRVCDGAQFVARAGPGYDAILVDGYDGDSLVEALSSRAFYEACRGRLNARGALVVNLWGSDRRFTETLACIETAFPAGTLCLPAEKPGNIIAFAFRDPPGNPRWDELEDRARELEGRYGLEFVKFVRGLRNMNRCDERCLYVSGAA
ncbi:MAG: spermidine synthase [Betaproteobacteria bacterium]|nr:spermidine synthase [Betaproteobacteria bacterium]